MVGEFVLLRRKELGLSRKELADKIKISYAYLNLIERNKRQIGKKKIKDFAKALKVDESKLEYFNRNYSLEDEKKLIKKHIEHISIEIEELNVQKKTLLKQKKELQQKLSSIAVQKKDRNIISQKGLAW